MRISTFLKEKVLIKRSKCDEYKLILGKYKYKHPKYIPAIESLVEIKKAQVDLFSNRLSL